MIFSPFRKQTLQKVTGNERSIERVWILTILGPYANPADILYRNQRWRIKISTCGTVLWQVLGGSLSQELLEKALLLRLGRGGSARAFLGPHRPRLVQVGVAAHQVYRALDVGKHLNLLYLRKGECQASSYVHNHHVALLWNTEGEASIMQTLIFN